MAARRTRCFLCLLLVTLQDGRAAAGPPVAPPPPECYISCEKKHCYDVIQCVWDLVPDHNSSLHWEPANSEHEHVATGGTSPKGVILREQFPDDGELRVWVQHDSVKSQEAVFHAEDIIKPPAPQFSLSLQEPLQIHWMPSCDELDRTLQFCDVRHRTEEDRVWPDHESELHGSYTVINPQPGTVYEFQVRCACDTGLMSDWSSVHRIRSAELAPVGEVDVWRDCGTSFTSSDCFLTWKNLSIAQARGFILGYDVRVSYKNGTAALMNVSTVEPSSRFLYDGVKWCLNSSLKDVSSASVSAYNALGATTPSYLIVPTTDIRLSGLKGKEDDGDIHLKMNEANLTVRWDRPSQHADGVKEYVVQYKRAGSPPGREFNWIKVNKSQTTGFLKGHFKKYTPYQVSLFTVSRSSEVRQLSSAIRYSLQKAPSAVPLFRVVSFAATDATVFWQPVALSQQTGLILYYQIGVDTHTVYNVSASPQHENKTFQLLHLSPSRDYEVWIRAVTAAGPGPNVTARFKTTHLEHFAHSAQVLLGIAPLFILILFSVISVSVCGRGTKMCLLAPKCFFEKVPEPSNSHIFRKRKEQMMELSFWICIPVKEPPHPKISLLEVVEPESQASSPDGSTGPVVGDAEDAVTEERDRTDRRYGREEYSKMVDSDEETDDRWSSSEHEEFTLGYEKHFMPSTVEILQV